MKPFRVGAVMLAAALTAAPAATQDPATTTGRDLTATFYAGRTDSIWPRMTPEMQRALGTAEGLAAFRSRVEATLGTEQSVLSESAEDRGAMQVYRRRARFSRFPGVIRVEWALTADGSIAGFLVAPDQSAAQAEAPSEHLDYRTRTRLGLPFDVPFTVAWGGRTVAQNYHAAVPAQRFALDLVIVNEGSTRVGDGRGNESYHCFGKPILAPGDGLVAVAVDGIADNAPGQMNADQLVGNHLVLDHGNGEFSLLAHLRNGTLRVRVGDRVVRGQRVAECGNSGNSSEPHLHYQLQDGPELGAAAALPAQFESYLADGRPVDRGEPVRGQIIAPRP